MQNGPLRYWLALNRVEGIGPSAFRALLERFGTPQAVFQASPSALRGVFGIGDTAIRRIADFSRWPEVENDLEQTARIGGRVITCQAPDYPALLQQVEDAPPFLYVKGSLIPDEATVALVGSRQASPHGRYTTERLARELSLLGVTVVSGMARGIDTAAHRGSLSAKGRTIAVLGSGLDVPYPPENAGLAEAITASGAVLSEHAPGTPPLAKHFPARNRIISGLCLGVVVVEATEKSGSLITARIALDQGREVFAVPGPIDAPASRGTNRLIKDGAKLVEGVEDILSEIQNRVRPESPPDTKGGTQPDRAPLTEAEHRVLDAIRHQPPIQGDDIVRQCGLSAANTAEILVKLQMQGRIRELPGKFYLREE